MCSLFSIVLGGRLPLVGLAASCLTWSLLLCGLLPGCLVPIPLEQENATDGGVMLFVERGDPPFGTSSVMQGRSQLVTYRVYAISDSPILAARLCIQVNESCCVLNPVDVSMTHCLFDATVTPIGGPGSNEYELAFPQVAPCGQDSKVARSYVVPVLATGGFVKDEQSFGVNGLGTVDQTHYWSVTCP